MFGVLLVIAVGAAAVAMFWRNIKRGKTFVRAVDFLMMLDCGSSVGDANKMAGTLLTKHSDPDTDNRAIHRSRAVAAAQFGGKQLPLIAMARSRGFAG